MSSLALSTQVHDLVKAAGQDGCGLESQFEAMYRFLADPFPPLNIVTTGFPMAATPQGIDQDVIAQRKAFLRSDSALAIVMYAAVSWIESVLRKGTRQ